MADEVILFEKLFPWSVGGFAGGGAIAFFALVFWFRTFLPSYMAKKGENQATREDFQSLLDQQRQLTEETEKVRQALAGLSWKQQQTWSRKEQLYLDLLLNLTKVRNAAQDLAVHYELPGTEDDHSIPDRPDFKALSEVRRTAFGFIRDQSGPAAVFLSARAVGALEDLIHGDWNAAEMSSCTAEHVGRLLENADVAYELIVKEARIALGSEGPE